MRTREARRDEIPTIVTMSLLAVALAGTCIPARRATRIDPAIALRHD